MSCRLLSCRSRYSKGTCGKNSVSTFVLSWGERDFYGKIQQEIFLQGKCHTDKLCGNAMF